MKRSRLWSAAVLAGLLLFSVSTIPVYAQDTGISESPDDTGASPMEGEEQYVFSGDGGSGTGEGENAPAELDTFGVWDLVRMVVVLLLVVAAVYGVITLLRRRIESPASDEESPIRVLASRTLSTNQELHAVMIGRQVMILGGGDGGLHLITRVEDQETIDELILAHSSGSTGGSRGRTFGSVLAQWLGNAAVPGAADSRKGEVADRPGMSLLKAQQNRLRNLR